MNVKLLRKIAKHISEEPKRLDMNNIAYETDPSDERAPKCGTVGCIAGWACILSGQQIGGASWPSGRDLLGLTDEEAERLFNEPLQATSQVGEEDTSTYNPNVWPLRFARRYEDASTPRGRANATVGRINHFIKTKGAE